MQNFPTKPVALSQPLYEQVCTFVAYPPYPGCQAFLIREYHVVDVVLSDGRRYDSLLVLNDKLLVAMTEADFVAADIVALTETPRERHADFTISDDAPLRSCGGRSMEISNLNRASLFHRPDPDPGREMPLDDAWDEALHDHIRFRDMGGDLPACTGIDSACLTPNGIEVSIFGLSADDRVTLTIRPRSAPAWREILECTASIAPGFTLGHLATLLDLPESVDREVYMRVMPWDADRFTDFVTATRAEGIAAEQGPDAVEYIEVHVHVDDDGSKEDPPNRFGFVPGALGVCAPATVDTEMYDAGQPRYAGISYGGPAQFRDCEIRLNHAMTFTDHDKVMAYYSGPLGAWHRTGQVGPRPPAPVEYVAEYAFTVRDVLRAVLREVSWENLPAAIVAPDAGSSAESR
jgi:hypothetical protein